MNLQKPRDSFWARAPFVDTGLTALGVSDAVRAECCRVMVSERAQRETILKQERRHMVHIVKEALYVLHLNRTDRLASSGAGLHNLLPPSTPSPFAPRHPLAVVQATTHGSGKKRAPSEEIDELGTLLSDECRERVMIESYESDSWGFLHSELRPRMLRLAQSLYLARENMQQLELSSRQEVEEAEAEGREELHFRHRIMRHTESVVMQLTKEDRRLKSIDLKMDQLGHRSIATFSRRRDDPPPPPSGRRPTQTKLFGEGYDDTSAASTPRHLPVLDHSEVLSPAANMDGINAHLDGLRLLRQIEESKLEHLRAQVMATDQVLRERLRQLQDYGETPVAAQRSTSSPAISHLTSSSPLIHAGGPSRLDTLLDELGR